MVRLSPPEVKILVKATHHCFGDTAKIWLFGSRADDTKRGGDIDLLIETDLISGIVSAKLKMREEIWNEFGEQKIDILVRSRQDEPSPIHLIAMQTGVELV